MRALILTFLLAAVLAGCGQESRAEHIDQLQRKYDTATAKQHRVECSLWGTHCK